jgi:amino acid adenylation domain-containing protein
MNFNYKTNLIQYFLETCDASPNKIAVSDGVKQINFSEIRTISYSLAQSIAEIRQDFNQPIGVYLPKSYNTIIANLGITMSGNVYMNLDINTPTDRISNILKLINPYIIITNNSYIDKIELVCDSNYHIINIDELEIVDFNLDFLQKNISNIIDTDPYCIINTSGSTGTPKGVVLNHKSFIDFTNISIDIFKLKESEIVGSLSPAVFDIYSFELCLMIFTGSTILIIPDNFSAFPIKLLELLVQHRVTFIFWVPTIMVNISNLKLLDKIQLPNLKTIWFAGEVFPTKQFNYWKKILSKDVVFANLYGPIEITLDCTYFIVNRDFRDDEPLPIGKAYPNTSILILNENDESIKLGEEGELCVRGTSLAMGYYNNWEKTNIAFVQNPLNKSYPELIYRTGDIVSLNQYNEIIFKGRKDSLIKHLGYRIELGEIEHVVVNDLKLFNNACAVYDSGNKEIILYYESNVDCNIPEIRKLILTKVPKYMVPNKFVKIIEMPRNTNGKIDRLLLKSLHGN